MKFLIGFLLLLLLVLHQDYWQWHRSDTVLGFVPYPLAWHIGISIATSLVWLLTVSCAWPEHPEDEITGKPAEQPKPGPGK